MPKLITTRVRTADLGKPGIISFSEDDSRRGAMEERRINVNLVDDLCHSLVRTLSYFIPINILKTTTVKTVVSQIHATLPQGLTHRYLYANIQNSTPFFLNAGVHY